MCGVNNVNLNPAITKIDLALAELNQMNAKILVKARLSDREEWCGKPAVSAACFEVGADGAKSDWPLAVAGPVEPGANMEPIAEAEFSLLVGTPFLWANDTHPRYAVNVSTAQGKRRESAEIQFGFDAAGRIVVTEDLKATHGAPVQGHPRFASLFVVGDSTAYSNGRNQCGWGEPLRQFFDSEKINLKVRAKPGRSTRSYLREKLWDRVLAELKPGDVVLIQFGHNDADTLNAGRCRGVLPGVGEESSKVKLPDGQTETVHTFGWYLRRFIADVRGCGATPVLLSLTAKNLWSGEIFTREQGEFGHWAGLVAREQDVPFVNLTCRLAEEYERLGRWQVQSLFCGAADTVHTCPAGAKLSARCVASELGNLSLFGRETGLTAKVFGKPS